MTMTLKIRVSTALRTARSVRCMPGRSPTRPLRRQIRKIRARVCPGTVQHPRVPPGSLPAVPSLTCSQAGNLMGQGSART